MDSFLRVLKRNICLCYLDDVVVYALTFAEHLRRLARVFTYIHEANLRLNPKKCHFGCCELQILGYVIDTSGIRPDSEKNESRH